MSEAQLQDAGSGLVPAGEGWFVVNARDAWWGDIEGLGFSCMFESWNSPFPQVGIRLTVLEPGKPNALYHSESQQEGFLVLSRRVQAHSSRARSGSSGPGTSSTVPPEQRTSSSGPETARA